MSSVFVNLPEKFSVPSSPPRHSYNTAYSPNIAAAGEGRKRCRSGRAFADGKTFAAIKVVWLMMWRPRIRQVLFGPRGGSARGIYRLMQVSDIKISRCLLSATVTRRKLRAKNCERIPYRIVHNDRIIRTRRPADRHWSILFQYSIRSFIRFYK